MGRLDRSLAGAVVAGEVADEVAADHAGGTTGDLAGVVDAAGDAAAPGGGHGRDDGSLRVEAGGEEALAELSAELMGKGDVAGELDLVDPFDHWFVVGGEADELVPGEAAAAAVGAALVVGFVRADVDAAAIAVGVEGIGLPIERFDLDGQGRGGVGEDGLLDGQSAAGEALEVGSEAGWDWVGGHGVCRGFDG